MAHSAELAIQSAEKQTSPSEIKAGLEKFYDPIKLKPMEVYDIGSVEDDQTAMDSCERIVENTRVCQKLLAVIEAGDEFFSVVEVVTFAVKNGMPDYSEMTAITRRVPGDRAELVGLVGDNEFMPIGRSFQTNNNYNNKVSRKHFTVGRKNNGNDAISVGIADFGSSNGTTVYKNSPNMGAISHNPDNPIESRDLWSVKSAKLKKAIDSAK